MVTLAACAPDALRYGGATAGEGGGRAGQVGAAGAGHAGSAGRAGDKPIFVSGPLPSARSCAGDLRCADGLSCCASIDVPRGDVLYGRSLDGTDAFEANGSYGFHEVPESRVTVSAFTLDTFEVTVGRFRAYVDAFEGSPPANGAGQHPHIAGTGWRSEWNLRLAKSREELDKRLSCDPNSGPWTSAKGANENKPVGCINWYEAMAFCIWDGGRLPTAREWELAAAGGLENRLYPWGSEPPDETRASFACLADGLPGCTDADVPEVGAFPSGNGLFGHRDLAGGMHEWVIDTDGFPAPCVDCIDMGPKDRRAYRGAAFYMGPDELRSVYSWWAIPAQRAETFGFRCAREPVKPSCAQNPRCGEGADEGGGRDCCESLTLPGGTFAFGRSDEGTDACPGPGCLSNEGPEHEATLSPYALDTYEVTVGRFLPFLDAYPASLPREGQGAHPRIPGSGWKKAWETTEHCQTNNADFESCAPAVPSSQAGLRDDLNGIFATIGADAVAKARPINTLSWYVAFAFCVWDGGRLPTEAEWEFAAAGGDQNRLYPWGQEPPTVERASFGCLFSGAEDCHIADLPRPGILPLGQARWGHQDMAGGVGEWVLDSFALYPETPCVDCAQLAGEEVRTARGGMFRQKVNDLRATRRGFFPARQRDSGVGIRCARDL